MKDMHIIPNFKSTLMIFQNGTFYFGFCYSYCVVLRNIHNHPTDPYLHCVKDSKAKEKISGALVGLNQKTFSGEDVDISLHNTITISVN